MHDLFPTVLAGSPARVLVRGLASLVEEMQRFAESFGMAEEQVFSNGCAFGGRRVDEVLRGWLRGGDEGARRLQALLDDISEHHRAIIKAMDEVAREAVVQSASVPRFSRPLAWSSGNRVRADLARNPDLRQEKVIFPAITREYIRIRTNSPSQVGTGRPTVGTSCSPIPCG